MKKKNQFRNENIASAILILIGIVIIIYCRIDGMDLTEGQIFAAYWPGWLAAIVSISAGLSILTNPQSGGGSN